MVGVSISSVWFVTLATFVGTTELARAEDCKPAAIAQGDPGLVKGLTAKLRASGIATSSSSGCPSVQVVIEPRGEQVHVKLADAFQRTSERDVQDIATAAAVVESWTYQVIEAGSMPAETIAAIAPVIATPHLVHSGIAASALS